jgi:N-dimethylarginine dimethylaminohydrolase
MHSTLAVEAAAEPDFGSTTIALEKQHEHYVKLLRFRNLKIQLAELRAEHERLEAELFGQAAS